MNPLLFGRIWMFARAADMHDDKKKKEEFIKDAVDRVIFAFASISLRYEYSYYRLWR